MKTVMIVIALAAVSIVASGCVSPEQQASQACSAFPDGGPAETRAFDNCYNAALSAALARQQDVQRANAIRFAVGLSCTSPYAGVCQGRADAAALGVQLPPEPKTTHCERDVPGFDSFTCTTE
jgi:outer membrane murein-binding lipoprotein Lpp